MKTLVVVDDNVMMREFLKGYLSKNYNVLAFESGFEAITYLQSHDNPDAILLDYEMEGMNGGQILKTIKSSGFYKNIPVLFLSGQKNSETRISCLESGADDFISKPFNPRELEVRLNKALN